MQTLWFLCLGGSLACLTAGIVWLWTGLAARRRGRDEKPLSPLNGMIVATVMAVLLLFLAANLTQREYVAEITFATFFHTVRVFLANEDLAVVQEALVAAGLPLQGLWASYASLLYFLAPTLLASFLLSFLKGVFSRMRYVLRLGRGDLYIFSQLNERSVLLAEDIARQAGSAKPLLVFTAAPAELAETNPQLKHRADKLRAYCFDEDAITLPVPARCGKAGITFFLLEDDETHNLLLGTQLVEKYRDVLPVNLYVASVRQEAELVFDTIEKGTKHPVRVRLIDESCTIVQHVMDTMPLFLAAENGLISVLIVGAGNIGMEVLKAVCWCGQLAGHRLEVHVVDQDPTAASHFARECPALAGEHPEDCDIYFHCLDITGQEFPALLRQHPQIGYVVCALGQEQRNLEAATYIRGFTQGLAPERCSATGQPLPIINLLVNDSFLSGIVAQLRNAQGAHYHLHPFGNLEQIYTWELISGSYFERLALAVHRFYGSSPESFEQSAYNRRSSMVTALHCKYKLFACPTLAQNTNLDWSGHPTPAMGQAYRAYLEGADLPEAQRAEGSAQRLEALARAEHRRWNAYIRTEGYQTPSPAELERYYPVVGRHNNLMSGRHPALVPWEQLDEVSQRLGRLRGKPVDLKQSDIDIVRAVPDILQQAGNGAQA